MAIANVPSQSTDKKYTAALEAKLKELEKRISVLESTVKNLGKRK